MTNSDLTRASSVMMSSATPSAKYSCSISPLMLVNGSTAIDGLPAVASEGGRPPGGTIVSR